MTKKGVESDRESDTGKDDMVFQDTVKSEKTPVRSTTDEKQATQGNEKEKHAAELIATNKELTYQIREKEKLATALLAANQELLFQNSENEKRAAELTVANKELIFQNKEKEKLAAALIIANKELAFQNVEKEKRAAELSIANKKLARENIRKAKLNVEKVQRADELIITNKELAYQENRGTELTLANDELNKAKEELGAFSYSVSHDLRAPIRAINGYTQILIEDYSDAINEEGKKVLQAVIYNSKKMGLLIDDLLAFSKLGRKQVTATAINMNRLVNSVIADIAIEENGTIPKFEVADLLPANGDQSLIKQVWINLISNAIKYSQYKPETKIKITAIAEKGTVVYCVQDWGAGFDMEYYDKLFGVFQRLHSQEDFDGTGIGLAIVQKIIDRHHGKVWAESIVDVGSSFSFSLPDINH